MKNIIAPCGNNCSVCPRHMPKPENELHNTAILWNKIGYRNTIVSNNEIQCYGCSPENFCRYKIIECVTEKNISNCGLCEYYPCKIINNAFKTTLTFQPACKSNCTNEEYHIIEKAFFEKKKNLDIYSNKINK